VKEVLLLGHVWVAFEGLLGGEGRQLLPPAAPPPPRAPPPPPLQALARTGTPEPFLTDATVPLQLWGLSSVTIQPASSSPPGVHHTACLQSHP